MESLQSRSSDRKALDRGAYSDGLARIASSNLDLGHQKGFESLSIPVCGFANISRPLGEDVLVEQFVLEALLPDLSRHFGRLSALYGAVLGEMGLERSLAHDIAISELHERRIPDFP